MNTTNSTVVSRISAFGGNMGIGQFWKETILNFLISMAKKEPERCPTLTFSLEGPGGVTITWPLNENDGCYAQGCVAEGLPRKFEEAEIIRCGISPSELKAKLFEFVHGNRPLLVVNFTDRLAWHRQQGAKSAILELYLWKTRSALNVSAYTVDPNWGS